MKKQYGFTLIELLLVLAIIGIISAIAIPSLIGQRARSRDKAAIANTDSVIADLVAGYDKAKEASADLSTTANFTTAVVGTAAAPLINNFFMALNPWATSGHLTAYAPVATETSQLGTDTRAAAMVSNLGQVQVGYLAPSGGRGCVASAVYANNTTRDAQGNNTNVYYKVASIE
jgi:type IV pilus assembly protein PilA